MQTTRHFVILDLLASIVLLFSTVHYGDCVRFIIVPSVDTPCPGEFTGESCITLQQYIANPSNSDVTLELQPGNHQLDSQLVASSIGSFTMIANITATVTCNEQLQESQYQWLRLNQVQNIYISGITFSGCRLTMEEINNATLLNNSFINKRRCCYRGTVQVHQSVLQIENNTFTNNTGSLGGVVNAQRSNITITDSKFTDNYYDGPLRRSTRGAIYILQFSDKNHLKIINSTFVNNRASPWGNGGAITVDGGDLTISGSYFYDNSAELNGNGGAIYFSGGNISVLHSTFESNVAGGGGGAIYSGKRFTNVSLVNNMFIDNSAAFCAVLDIDEFNHYSIVIDKSTFTHNRAVGQVAGVNGGGVFCIRNGSITVRNSTFNHNTAEGNAGVAIIDESEIAIENSNFTNNTAMRDGGVFYTYFYPTGYTIVQSTFSGNQADNDGGVMYVGRAGSHVTLRGNGLANNQANERGGVLAIIGSSLFISGDNRLEDNTARLGEIASVCNTQITALSLSALARADSVQPQCTLYDHSDTTLPPITTPPPSTTPLDLTSESITGNQRSTTTQQRAPDTSTMFEGSDKTEAQDITTSSKTTTLRDTTTTTFFREEPSSGSNTIGYIAIALASILFLLILAIAIVIPIYFTRKLNALKKKTPDTKDTEEFIMTTNGIYQLNASNRSPPIFQDRLPSQGDYEN